MKKFFISKLKKVLKCILTSLELFIYIHYNRNPFDPSRFDKGINFIGPVQCDTGLGQSARLLVWELNTSSLPFTVTSFVSDPRISHENHSFDSYITNQQPYGINIFHINMHEFLPGLLKLGLRKLDHHYDIAFWLWETETFPKEWIPLIRQMDEIWTPSEFICTAIRKVTDKPVITIPYHVTAPVNEHLTRGDFGLPEDKFLFLMMFDKSSTFERKNPEAVIQAFKRAFRESPESRTSHNDAYDMKHTPCSEQSNDLWENENSQLNKDKKTVRDPALVIKISNGTEEDFQKLRAELRGYNVFFIKDILPKEDVNRLVQLCDVYVSLHRSEGYGLVLAEAMLLGTPTIATAYSANMEFQTSTSACLVSYKLQKVGHEVPPYHIDDFWAEPDIQEAANYMTRLNNDPMFYTLIRDEAYKEIQRKTDSIEISHRIKNRLENIYFNQKQLLRKRG